MALVKHDQLPTTLWSVTTGSAEEILSNYRGKQIKEFVIQRFKDKTYTPWWGGCGAFRESREEQSVARENVDTKGFCGGGGGAASVTGADQYRVAMETAGTDRVARCCCCSRVRPLNFDNLARSTNRKTAEKTSSCSQFSSN